MANLYRSGYLHLFYDDYAYRANFNPYGVIEDAKQKIRKVAEEKLENRISTLGEEQRELEELYNLKPGEFEGLMQKTLSPDQNSISSAMLDFDAAIEELKKLAKEGQQDVQAAEDLSNQIVESIDKILLLGAETGGLGAAAVAQIKEGLNRFNTKVRLHLKYVKNKSLGVQRKRLLNEISDVQSNVSGYMEELSSVYGPLVAHEFGLGKVLNIGGYNLTREGNVHIDPKLSQAYSKVQEALSQNNGTQSKVDGLMMFGGGGSGVVSYTTSYRGLQDKNVKDISHIKVGTFTLQELGIESYYTSNFLTNVAGGLAGSLFREAKEKAGISADERTHGNDSLTQTSVDEIWANIKDSVKILGKADAIAGELNANITNKVDYYVVRKKESGGQVRVISSRTVLKNILKDLRESANSDTINFVGGKGSDRGRYWRLNYTNYVPLAKGISSKAEAAELRSDKAYDLVLEEIRKTKISIAVDFGLYFN